MQIKHDPMPQETERKFLVESKDFIHDSIRHYRITQAYLSSVPERNVRIRLKGDKAFITIKGASTSGGTTRYEWEKEISLEDALELLKLCEPGAIDKTRYEIPCGKHLFEVDVFHGENTGLIVAEIELAHPDEAYDTPPWLGKEITGDNRYYNAMLTKQPFSRWK